MVLSSPHSLPLRNSLSPLCFFESSDHQLVFSERLNLYDPACITWLMHVVLEVTQQESYITTLLIIPKILLTFWDANASHC